MKLKNKCKFKLTLVFKVNFKQLKVKNVIDKKTFSTYLL